MTPLLSRPLVILSLRSALHYTHATPGLGRAGVTSVAPEQLGAGLGSVCHVTCVTERDT